MFRLVATFLGLHLVLALPLDASETSRKPANSVTEFPYQVLISQLDDSPKCGGVLVAEGFILTSASCVLEFGGIKKLLEEAVLYGGGTSLLFEIGDVSDAVIHPQYTVRPKAFDLAVVKYIPSAKSPHVNSVTLSGIWTDQNGGTCIMSSWWNEAETTPERLVWEPVYPAQCTPPDHDVICFADDSTVFLKDDFGSPIVCGGVLVGLVPRGGGNRAINVTSDYSWVTEAMTELTRSSEQPELAAGNETKQYLLMILQKIDNLKQQNPSSPDSFDEHMEHWNKQVVVPLSYVLFALVIFFFVLLFFIILFTVVLVYYSKK